MIIMKTDTLQLLEGSIGTRNPVPNFSTKQIILSMRKSYSHTESIIISILAINSGGYEKTTIGEHQYTLVNSSSMVPPIGLPPKGADFCHTLNILLVGHQHRRALSQL
jgi:hypothetical protein